MTARLRDRLGLTVLGSGISGVIDADSQMGDIHCIERRGGICTEPEVWLVRIQLHISIFTWIHPWHSHFEAQRNAAYFEALVKLQSLDDRCGQLECTPSDSVDLNRRCGLLHFLDIFLWAAGTISVVGSWEYSIGG